MHDAFSQVGVGVSSGGYGMGTSIGIRAHGGGHQGKNPEKQVQQLKKDLDLTDDQVVQVRNLMMERERAHEIPILFLSPRH